MLSPEPPTTSSWPGATPSGPRPRYSAVSARGSAVVLRPTGKPSAAGSDGTLPATGPPAPTGAPWQRLFQLSHPPSSQFRNYRHWNTSGGGVTSARPLVWLILWGNHPRIVHSRPTPRRSPILPLFITLNITGLTRISIVTQFLGRFQRGQPLCQFLQLARFVLHQFPQPAILLFQCCHPLTQGLVPNVLRVVAFNVARFIVHDTGSVPELLLGRSHLPGHPPGVATGHHCTATRPRPASEVKSLS